MAFRSHAPPGAPPPPAAPHGAAVPPPLFALLRQYAGVEPSEHATRLIKRVHDDALEEYRVTKKRKQQQLAGKIVDAQRVGDRVLLKTAKKKVANHASAVASRVKQEFIVSSFERLLTDNIVDAFRLSDVLYRHALLLADKDDQIRRLSDRVAVLTQQLLLPQTCGAVSPIGAPPSPPSPPPARGVAPFDALDVSGGSGGGSGGGGGCGDDGGGCGDDGGGCGNDGGGCGNDGGGCGDEDALSFGTAVELHELLSRGALHDGGSCGCDVCVAAAATAAASEKLRAHARAALVPSRQRALRDALLTDADARDVSLNPVA